MDTIQGKTLKIKVPKICYFIGIALVLYIFISSLFILLLYIDKFEYLKSKELLELHLMCASLGMLTSAMAAVRKFYRYMISGSTALMKGKNFTFDWSFGWIYYYLTRPILGCVLGALTFTFCYVGFNTLAGSSDISIADNGIIILYGLACITGYSVSHVLDRLEEVAKQLFPKKATDLIEENENVN